MSVIAVYDCSLLAERKKNGDLKKEGDYSEITLGAFDCLNSRDEYYVFNNNIKQMFEPGGALNRRLGKANLRGELEHPAPVPGQSIESFINRIRSISLTNVSHHISKVRLESHKDENGKTVVLAIGLVAPAGPHANVLERALANREENVCFSIRAMSRRWQENMRINREITSIVTWDFVNEPGIAYANKYDTPTLESFADSDLAFTEADLTKAEMYADQLEEAVTMESEPEVDFTMIRRSMGWEKVQKVSLKRSPTEWK